VIIDTSALISILRAEDDARDLASAIETARVRRISAASFLETAVLIEASRDPRRIARRVIRTGQLTAERSVSGHHRPAASVLA
jgi:uncharacterized protein with PIN domain